MGWVVNATPRTLYHRERPNIDCTGGWVARAGLDGCGKSRSHTLTHGTHEIGGMVVLSCSESLGSNPIPFSL
jgi:hypothetical protein